MAVTLSDIVDLVNDHIDDSSEDRITNNRRFRKINEAVSWIQEQLENDHQVKSVTFDYYDSVNRYAIESSLASLLDTNRLHKPLGEDYPQFTKRSASDMMRELADGTTHEGYAIEWSDGEPTILINYNPTNKAVVLGSLDSTTADGGEWEVYNNASNLREDDKEYTQGTGSLVFDYASGDSGIKNESLSERDLEDYKGLGTWLFDIYIPDVTDVSTINFAWGSENGYYYTTVTKDLFDRDFVSGEWMTIAVDWDVSELSTSGTIDDEKINYITAGLTSTGSIDDVRIDNIRLVIPSPLELKYLSYVVGKDGLGSDITKFSSLSDVPYFSDQYDNLRFPVAHKAASLIFKDMRLYDDQQNHENDAVASLRKLGNLIPRSRSKEVRSFRPRGVNFSRGRRF